MSKRHNVNPNFYYEGEPSRQDHPQRHPEKVQDEPPRRHQGKEGEPNFIPGAAPVGERSDDND